MKHIDTNKRSEQEFVDPLRYFRILLGEVRHIPIKTIGSSDDTYIQYDCDGDGYFRTLLLKNILRK